jgi:hypothetical protein
VLALARRQPSAILLAAQLLGVLVYPAMEGSDVGRALFSVFGIAILGLVLLAVRSTPALSWVGVLLGAPATVLLLIQAITQDDVITRDELFAVGATFTLVAWAFAYTFTVYQAIEPNSFTAAVDPSGERTWVELLFLSFTTLSSTGLGDVIPIKPFARSLVMIEQVAGVAYIAMVVSRLIGLLVLHPQSGRSR